MDIKTKAYKRCEIILNSLKDYENPFMDVDIDATFTHSDGTIITIPGFWNGENQWKVRFSSEIPGIWTYNITCTDTENKSLFDKGTIDVAPCLDPKNNLEKHGYVRLAPGKKHMVYADGTPFFYLADTHWMMPDFERLHECNYPGCNCGNQFKHLADDRIKKGFNVYQTYFSGARVGKHPSGAEGWWTDHTFTKINPNAFNTTMDVMIEYLADNGITIALGFGTHYSTVKLYKQNVTAMKAFARYCVARYACYPLIWITAQEITNYTENAFDCWKQVGAYVGELDGFKRPNGAHMHVHPLEEARSQELDKEPWHQWWTVQAGHGGYDKLKMRDFYKGYYFDKKMFIEAECQYEDVYCRGFCGHDATRMGAWNAVQNGSGGFTYGATGIWAMGWHQKYSPGLLAYSPESWFNGMDKPGSDQVCFMKKFYEYVSWQDLEPCFDHSLGNFDDRNHVAISHKKDEVFVYYFFSVYTDTGYIAGLRPNAKYQARLFDTIVGKFIDIDDITASNAGTCPIPPFPAKRDWVLLLNLREINFGSYEAYKYPTIHRPIAASEAILGEELKIVDIKVSSEDEAFPKENLIDNNPETYWQGFAPQTSQTITADLGETKHFDYVHIDCADTLRFVKFRIMGSNDGENFDLLTERSEMIVIGGRFSKYFDATSGDYRYIRFFLNSDQTLDTPIKIAKFAIYTKAEE